MGPQNYHMWFNRLEQVLLDSCTEISEYASTGDIRTTTIEYNLDEDFKARILKFLDKNLFEVIRRSTVGEPHTTVMDSMAGSSKGIHDSPR